jgi:hypothetical protein
MIPQFTFDLKKLRQALCLMLVSLLIIAGLPLLNHGNAAAAQFSHRSIQMSDSSPSGGTITSGIGSGTSVTYQVTFTNASAAESMVIDFCTQDPIIGDTCTTPTSMSTPSALSLPTTSTGTMGGTGWTLDTSGAGQIKLKDTSGTHSAVAGGTQQFDVKFTNPSTTGTYYARMYSYCDNSYGSTNCAGANTTFTGAYSNATNPGGYTDYGGIALSTASVITITARVQESLTFCVTKAAPGSWSTTHDCSDPVVAQAANLPSLILGHGSPTAVLDSNNVDTGDIYTQLSTNATYGAVINLHSSNTTCGGLSADNGVTCAIPPVNAGSAAGPTKITAGTAAFGMVVFPGGHDTNGGIGSLTPTTPYYTNTTNDPEDAALTIADTNAPTNATSTTEKADYFGMDNTSTTGSTNSLGVANNGQSSYNGAVTSTFGSTLAYSNSPVYRAEDHYAFGATSALTTPAGIYTANLSMVATGTF